MIVFWLLRAVHGLADAFLNIFPPAESLDVSWISSVSSFTSVALQLDSALPIHEILDAIGLYAVVFLATQSVNVIRRIWSLVSGGGGA